MSARLCVSLLMLTLQGCSSTPPLPSAPSAPVIVKVPVVAPCVDTLPMAPEKCVQADKSRPEALRCVLVDKIRGDAYTKELEALLLACKGESK
jgi:hypothetical protein